MSSVSAGAFRQTASRNRSAKHRRSFSVLPVREATSRDARAIHRLIVANLVAGHLLPRTLDELTVHAFRFLVATHRRRVVACAELAPLSHSVAEVRSLVVDEPYRGAGVSTRLVRELTRRARLDGYTSLCAFTHEPTHFVRLGFSIVPHAWLPEKIVTDCHTCPLFRHCGQHAMLVSLSSLAARAPRPQTSDVGSARISGATRNAAHTAPFTPASI